MRLVSVVSAVGIGLVLGSAAVVSPLVIGSASVSSVGWISQARSNVTALWASATWQRGVAKHDTASADQSVALQAPKVTAAQDESGQDALARVRPQVSAATKPLTGDKPVADAKTTQAPWTTQVTVEPDGAAPRKLTSSKPVTENQRHKLVADLQAELARVGCYEGEADGVWGPGTRRAMAAFTERVNASLPYEQPDLILLTLVQGHKGRACGVDCPAGQGRSDSGRCIPSSIVAQGERGHSGDPAKIEKPNRAVADKTPSGHVGMAWSANTPVSGQLNSPSRVDTGSRAEIIAGVAPAPVRVTRDLEPIARDSGRASEKIEGAVKNAAPAPAVKDTRVAATVPELTPQPITVNRDRMFPGRMTMGAPLPPPDAAPANPTSTKASKTATQVAAVDDPVARPAETLPVTAAEPAIEPALKARNIPRSRAAGASRPELAVAPPIHRHVLQPVVVHRPAPLPRVTYVAPQKPLSSGGGSKSRRLVYEMFQRVDRN